MLNLWNLNESFLTLWAFVNIFKILFSLPYWLCYVGILNIFTSVALRVMLIMNLPFGLSLMTWFLIIWKLCPKVFSIISVLALGTWFWCLWESTHVLNFETLKGITVIWELYLLIRHFIAIQYFQNLFLPMMKIIYIKYYQFIWMDWGYYWVM